MSSRTFAAQDGRISPAPVRRTQSSTALIPGIVRQVTPRCAQTCLSTFIKDRFSPACSVSQSLSCICSTSDNSGSALHEGLLQCIRTSCPPQEQAAPINDFCAGYTVSYSSTSSISPPHATMTLLPPSIPNPSLTSFQPGVIVDTSTTHTSHVPTSPPSVSDTQNSKVTATSAASDEAGKLTSAQISGIVVAGLATAVIVFCLLGAVVACLHRRRRLARSPSADIDKPLPLGGYAFGENARYAEGQNLLPWNYTEMYPKLQPEEAGTRPDPEKIGIAVSHEAGYDGDPSSAESTHSLAQLLPRGSSKGLETLPRKPAQSHQKENMKDVERAMPSRPQQLREREVLKTTERTIPPALTITPASESPANGSSPTVPPSIQYDPIRCPPKTLPKLVIPLNKADSKPLPTLINTENPTDITAKVDIPPMPQRLESPASATPTSAYSGVEGSRDLVPSYYSSAIPDGPKYELSSQNSPNYPGPLQVGTQYPESMQARPKLPAPTTILPVKRASLRRSLGSRLNKVVSPKNNSRNSMASDTSFESCSSSESGNESDMEAHPRTVMPKNLTPLVESPKSPKTPLTAIKYPKVPRSSNQAVPRSPGSQFLRSRSSSRSSSRSTSRGPTSTPPVRGEISQFHPDTIRAVSPSMSNKASSRSSPPTQRSSEAPIPTASPKPPPPPSPPLVPPNTTILHSSSEPLRPIILNVPSTSPPRPQQSWPAPRTSIKKRRNAQPTDIDINSKAHLNVNHLIPQTEPQRSNNVSPALSQTSIATPTGSSLWGDQSARWERLRQKHAGNEMAMRSTASPPLFAPSPSASPALAGAQEADADVESSKRYGSVRTGNEQDEHIPNASYWERYGARQSSRSTEADRGVKGDSRQGSPRTHVYGHGHGQRHVSRRVEAAGEY